MSGFAEIKYILQQRAKFNDGVFSYLPQVSEFQRQEIIFHDQIHQDEIEVHQLQTVRNQYYHHYFKKWLYGLPPAAVILEIGSGSGFDLPPLLARGYRVIASDISSASIRSVRGKIDLELPAFKDNLLCLAADGQNLPLPDESLEAVFMVASFHHFEDQARAIAGIKRLVKKNGLVILAMEPSRLMMKVTRLFKATTRLRIHQGHSAADASHNGFTKKDWFKISGPAFSLIKLKPVWCLLGLAHYLLEGIFRIFRLKKRLKLPIWLERLLLVVDEVLLSLPLVSRLNWHWIAIYKKE